ncbi:MAG: glycosyltransferase [Bacteroidales bacterium]|nr:glycosyltransferase [Bacteroidales bacterium]
MKVAIFLGFGKGDIIDAQNIEKGNPGVGGTQYCMLELAHYLNNNTNFQISIIAQRNYILEEGIDFLLLKEENNLYNIIKTANVDILILSQFNDNQLKQEISKINCKVITWSHNYIYSDFCNFISKTDTIKANVFVGKQQYDRYIDDNVIEKSTFIHNMFLDNSLSVVRENDNKTVIYMGALVEGKGFAELCSIWQSIIQEIPEAQLFVLGSGKLYGNCQLGKYGIASQEYENKFIKHIVDEKGSIIPSVKFLGIIGEGKTEIFRKASVGVVNPSARTETFCMGVVEMAEAKLPVVTLGKNSYFDTVDNGNTGILTNSLEKLKRNIIYLLKNSEKNETLGNNAKKRIEKFSPNNIGPKWVKLLNDVYADIYKPTYLKPSKPMNNNNKWIRVIIRFLRYTLHLRFIPSLIKVETFITKLIHKCYI